MTRLAKLLCLIGLLTAASVAVWRLLPSAPAADAPPAARPAPDAKPAPSSKAPSFEKDVAPLVKKYCTGCHGGEKPKGGLALDAFRTAEDVAKKPKVWEKVADNLRSGDMPPPTRRQPTMDERDLINNWIDLEVFKVDCNGPRDPGRVTIRRLNRAEYNNTIRDLVGVSFRPADDFPADDVGYGFDNIGDVLSMPPILLEKYLAAAENILDRALVPEREVKPARQRFGVQNLVVEPFSARDRAFRRITFTTAGQTYLARFHFPHNGDYDVRIRALGERAGADLPRLSLRLDDKEVKTFDVDAEGTAKVYEFRIKSGEGERKVAAAFTNPFRDDKAKDDKKPERKLIIENLEIEGPFNAAPVPASESYRRVMIARPTGPGDKETAAAKIVETFARRAFRRPVTKDETARLMKLFKLADGNGESFDDSVKLALKAVLVSPHFLFRVEVDREPNNPDAVTTISEFELASRLSYFLWSSMPDDELFNLAEQGQLRKPGVLEAQVKRMLRDPKSRALVENFADQWLQLRNLKDFSPDPKRFPTFNEPLRQAMLKETELFFDHVVREDRSILEFLDADYTFLNERLAEHYGIPGVKGADFRKVTLTAEQHQQRGGLMMQASILTVTSNPTRTSPVKRGKFILDNILGTPPPPPPPDVPELKDDGELKGTLRQRMEQHRANPTCAACHQRMDPLGFGFENFNAVGAWRVKDGKEDVDPTGDLPGGKSFKGPAELRSILKERKEIFARCLADKLLTYALGRGTKRTDQCFTNDIARGVSKRDYKFSALALEIVQSDPFQKRRGKQGGKP
jgi:hypothetical protein